MPHPAMVKDNVAVITGGGSGIGLAAAMRFAALGMKVCIADIGDEALKAAEAKLSAASRGGGNVMAAKVDVSNRDELTALETTVQKRFGGTDILMNNAGISPGARMFGPLENWQRRLENPTTALLRQPSGYLRRYRRCTPSCRARQSASPRQARSRRRLR